MSLMLARHLLFMISQMVDSPVPTTRAFWRRKLGLPETVVNDPRPLAEAVEERAYDSADAEERSAHS
jgi:hypothetical protein